MRETFGITAVGQSKMINDSEIKDDVQRNKENYLSYVFFINFYSFQSLRSRLIVWDVD